MRDRFAEPLPAHDCRGHVAFEGAQFTDLFDANQEIHEVAVGAGACRQRLHSLRVDLVSDLLEVGSGGVPVPGAAFLKI